VETYKFGERVALDGVATNEIGQGAELLDSHSPIAGGAAKAGINLTPLTLMYDLTPPALITAVCTEVSNWSHSSCLRVCLNVVLTPQIGFIPPSSVPTVLGKTSGVA
jgi:translation initiation factor eIF-2B subunit delta